MEFYESFDNGETVLPMNIIADGNCLNPDETPSNSDSSYLQRTKMTVNI